MSPRRGVPRSTLRRCLPLYDVNYIHYFNSQRTLLLLLVLVDTVLRRSSVSSAVVWIRRDERGADRDSRSLERAVLVRCPTPVHQHGRLLGRHRLDEVQVRHLARDVQPQRARVHAARDPVAPEAQQIRDFASFAHAHEGASSGLVRAHLRHADPDAAFRVQADASEQRAHFGPHAAVSERAVLVDGEGGEPPGQRLAHDERPAVRGDDHPVGQQQVGGLHAHLPVHGVDAHERRGAAALHLGQVEASVAQVHAARRGHHQLVGAELRDARHVRVELHAAGRLVQHQHLPRLHAHDEHAAVGQPTDGGHEILDVLVHDAHALRGQRVAQHLLAEHVDEVQRLLGAPEARAVALDEAADHERRHAFLVVASCACCAAPGAGGVRPIATATCAGTAAAARWARAS
ncbi:hypothetical protein ON010_g934 [Phytophthora cinnamomi]|nr:hypothetical protein ON010_g934 [Phytophthora cinnamomi]